MKKLSVVLCDNDEDELLFAREGFEKSGLFEVMATLESGNELISYLFGLGKANLPNLVISDLNMPGLTGYDVLARLKHNPDFERLPIYISSTSTSNLAISKCKDLGAHDYLVKPMALNCYHQFADDLYHRISKQSA